MMGCSNKRATISCSDLCLAAKTSSNSYFTTTAITPTTSTTSTIFHHDINTAIADSYLNSIHTSMNSSCASIARRVKKSSIFPDANYLALELGQLCPCQLEHTSIPSAAGTSMSSGE